MKIPGEVDLLQQLSEITEKKPETNITEAEIIQEPEKAKINPDDFDYNNINDVGKEPIPSAEPIEVNPIEPPPTFEQFKDEARALVGFFGGISCMFLPTLYRNKLLSKEEYILAKQLLKRIKKDRNAETAFSPKEWDIYEKILQLEEYEETLPLSEKETESIAQPLAELMQKYGKKTSPEMRLLFAIGTVYIPRTLVLIGRR